MEIARNNPFWIVLGIVVLALGVLFLLPFAQDNVSGKALYPIRPVTSSTESDVTTIPNSICSWISSDDPVEVRYEANNQVIAILTCTQGGTYESPLCVCSLLYFNTVFIL